MDRPLLFLGFLGTYDFGDDFSIWRTLRIMHNFCVSGNIGRIVPAYLKLLPPEYHSCGGRASSAGKSPGPWKSNTGYAVIREQ